MQQPSNDPFEVPEGEPEETPEELKKKVAALRPLIDRASQSESEEPSWLEGSLDENGEPYLTPGQIRALLELGLL